MGTADYQVSALFPGAQNRRLGGGCCGLSGTGKGAAGDLKSVQPLPQGPCRSHCFTFTPALPLEHTGYLGQSQAPGAAACCSCMARV